jgi:6-phosphogluconolactonase
MLLFALASASAKEIHFYLGTYTDQSGSKGIYEGTLDEDTGKLGPLTLAAPASDPSFLAWSPDGNCVYAALEDWRTARVEAFRRETDGSLTALNTRTMTGSGTCFVSCDPIGPRLFAANYNSGNIVGFNLERSGAIGPTTALRTFTGSGPNAQRQSSPHAHSVYPGPDGRCVYACDLGTDKVWIFDVSLTGVLRPNQPPFARVPPGSGARHLAFSADGKFVYASNEMGHSVTVFARDSATNGLDPLQTISVLPAAIPEKGVTTAEIVLHPSGKWLYVSSRGCDTISVLEIGADGKLTLIQSVPALVNGPRNFAIAPGGKWLIVGGQNDNRIAELKIDPATGLLTATQESEKVGSPVCVLFENAP